MSDKLFGQYKLVLGLEIHLHLRTEKKMFCRCNADVYGKEPNTHTCPTCLGLPGALPVPNLSAIEKTQILGLALNSSINKESRFDRKHYFYPDLPKGYQISQYKNPLCTGGYLELEDGKKAEIERVHLEEDTAKSMHEKGKTLIDFNLSSIPLVEIVTKPTFKTVGSAVAFSRKIQELVRELDLGDADMEKGQMRLEPNISLRTEEMEKNNELPPYKVEIKNINSFRFMENAVIAEVKRQRKLLEDGKTPVQENRGYIEEKKTTVSQRTKEHAHDYRYFPEPDIPPMVFDEDHIKKIEKEYKKLVEASPSYKKEQLLGNIKLEKKLKTRIKNDLEVDIIDKIVRLISAGQETKEVANLFLNNKEIRNKNVDDIITMIEQEKDKLSDTDELLKVVKQVLSENQDAVESYKGGKENALQFLVGMVMRKTQGKADVDKAKQILLQEM